MKQYQNIKNQILKIKNLIHRSKIFEFFIVILIFAFLFLNFFSVQMISPIYSQLVNNDKKATVIFLQKIKTIPEYQKLLEMNNNIFGKSIKEEISTAENKKINMINILEQQLAYTPKSRDVLYSLYQLYLQEGNNLQAQIYLQKVKDIDPGYKSNIKN